MKPWIDELGDSEQEREPGGAIVNAMLSCSSHQQSTQLDLNISHSIRSIGTLSRAPRKNKSSIIFGLTDRREGSISNSLPNLTCWSGLWLRQYSPSMACAWSWSLSTMWGALRPRRSASNCGKIMSIGFNMTSIRFNIQCCQTGELLTCLEHTFNQINWPLLRMTSDLIIL